MGGGGGMLGVHVSATEKNLIFQDHLLPVPELKAPFMSFLPLPHKQSVLSTAACTTTLTLSSATHCHCNNHMADL